MSDKRFALKKKEEEEKEKEKRVSVYIRGCS
jgi:hypothetical protein